VKTHLLHILAKLGVHTRAELAAFAAGWAALERLYADDVQYRDPDTRLSSRAAVLDRLRGQVDAFGGFDCTISRTYGDSADGAVVEWEHVRRLRRQTRESRHCHCL
jgi:SnoaL-like domain